MTDYRILLQEKKI